MARKRAERAAREPRGATGWRALLAATAIGAALLGASRDASAAPACRWSYPVGSAPESGPAPLANNHPVGGTNLPQYGRHLGGDFWNGGGCAALGQPVRAAADGVVVEAIDDLGSYLDVVVIRHDDPEIGKVYTMYGHIAREAAVKKGAAVARGQQIGTIANVLAYFSPCHLHFEILSEESFASGPFCSGCQAAGYHVSPGYDQKRGITEGKHPVTGDPFIEVNDDVVSNRWYVTDPFLKRRMTRPCGSNGEDGGASSSGTSSGGTSSGGASSGGASSGGAAPSRTADQDDEASSGCAVAPDGSPSSSGSLFARSSIAIALALVVGRLARRRR
jgi:murein DD-endopeptidase MepM/ murein hydrolase activator NlpD